MLSQFSGKYRSRWFTSCAALVLALSCNLGGATSVQAQSWLELMFRGIQIIQLSSMSDRQEVSLGRQVNQQLIQQGQFRPSRNRRLQAYINEIGQRLAPVSARPNVPYTFQVVEDDAINAFATMGGFVYINTGLIAAADNEAELASVIAHEIAHIADRHAVSRMRDIALSKGLMSATGLQESTAVNLAVQYMVNLPMNREDERAADRLGLENIIRAGYAPEATVSFMRKLQQKGGSPPEFLSTHPLTQNRVRDLDRAIPRRYRNWGDGLDPVAYNQRIGRR